MYKQLPLIILASAFSWHMRALADIPLENELEDADQVEQAVGDESRVKAPPPKAPENTPAPPSKGDAMATPAPAAPRARAQSEHRHNENAGVEEKAPSSSGEPIFDWKSHHGETEVKHPFAEKGLIRVTKDKTYIYKVDPSESHKAMQLQAGVLDPKNLRDPDEPLGTKNSTFQENYKSSSNPTILLTREWDGWVGALGKINYRLGSGIFVAQGHAHFVSDRNQDKEPMENFTFLALPTSAGIVYRLQFSDHPLLVPYVEGGVTGWLFSEIRDDKKGPKFGVSPSAYAAAGLALNMTYFDYLTRIHIDREYGITGIYFTAEYRRMQAIVDRYDFSGDYINGGFLMQY